MISLRNVRASLARLISPPGLLTVAIPDSGTGTPPAMRIVAQAAPVAPVAAAPRFRRAPVGPNGLSAFQEKLQIEARLKTEFGWHEKLEAAGVDYKARRKVLADFDRFVAGRPPGKSTAPKSGTVDDEGNVPVPTPPPDSGDGLDAVIKMLLDGVEKLKLLLPAAVAVDADDGDDITCIFIVLEAQLVGNEAMEQPKPEAGQEDRHNDDNGADQPERMVIQEVQYHRYSSRLIGA